MKERKNKY